ncbi:DNA repair endonuclease XPF-like [Acanthaster planci]|uniref:DNA repair endonuclease XPF n=1 Tax=Acanthaster planci TaxID=133434 RepID=A0A8B7Z5H7_ACAPL|nr:DNA repair endonuclease XPF-like [Acanthaster planci]
MSRSSSTTGHQLSEYENQMFLEIFGEDGLLLMARGLGIDRIALHILNLYSDPGNLVLVVNTSSSEEGYYIEELEKRGVSTLPKVINNEYGTNERRDIYLQGGVLFVTSRILVVDMLTDRLPIDLVTGVLVFKAHKIIESCQEAFILRLYRQKNKTGFIKALSDQPQSFAAGLCQLERVMRNLFVRKLFLWPRFHASVTDYMDAHKPDVVEIQLKLSPSMLAIQTAILDIIAACIKEVQRCNPSLDSSEITVEAAIGRKSLEQAIRRQLQPLWHQLTSTTKQLVADLKLLQMLLYYLTQYDCVTFYNFLKSLRSSEKTVTNNSGWLFMEAAESMFAHAKGRVYKSSKTAKGKITQDGEGTSDRAPATRELNLEENPKWKVLSEIMEEIKQESTAMKSEFNSSRILICASDDRTCAQLKEYLQDGGQELLQRLYAKTLADQSSKDTDGTAAARQMSNQTAKNRPSRGRRKARGQKSVTGKDAGDAKDKPLTLTQMVRGKGGPQQQESESDNEDAEMEVASDEEDKPDEEALLVSSPEAYYGITTSPLTVIHPLHGCHVAPCALCILLQVFKASRPGHPLRVYFLIYCGSTEEQRYLTSLRQEKQAFEHLIKEKATMALPEEVEGHGDTAPQLNRDQQSATGSLQGSSSRAGGRQSQGQVQQKVIVDMREFRSELPSLIHKRGIDIEPVTIEVGDYILTPDICVERKSVSDLIGSLASGRLFNQCTAMTRYYKHPMLLIEFDPKKSFSLQSKSTASKEISYQDLSSKIALLTMHFPKLRILWCPSPHATAQLFEELKAGREQPDASAAATVTASEEAQQARYNHGPYDMLLKMPGININNCRRLLKCVSNFTELSALSQEQLAQALEHSGNAALLWSFLHSKGSLGKDTAKTANPAGKFQRGSKRPFYGRKKGATKR